MTDAIRPPFTVTPSAIQAIETLGGAVLVDLEEAGCCGTFYAFSRVGPDGSVAVEADRYGCEGAWLFVSHAAGAVLPGATLDYGARLRPPRFRVVRNPNTTEVCGCRRSFGKPWPGPGSSACRSYVPMPWDEEFEPPRAWANRTGWSR